MYHNIDSMAIVSVFTNVPIWREQGFIVHTEPMSRSSPSTMQFQGKFARRQNSVNYTREVQGEMYAAAPKRGSWNKSGIEHMDSIRISPL